MIPLDSLWAAGAHAKRTWTAPQVSNRDHLQELTSLYLFVQKTPPIAALGPTTRLIHALLLVGFAEK